MAEHLGNVLGLGHLDMVDSAEILDILGMLCSWRESLVSVSKTSDLLRSLMISMDTRVVSDVVFSVTNAIMSFGSTSLKPVSPLPIQQDVVLVRCQ